MNQIDKCIEELIAAILESEEYRQYQAIREKVKQEPEKERAIHEFRRRNFEMRKYVKKEDLFDEFDRFEKEFEQFHAQPLVDDYLAAELSVCRLIQRINKSLLENVEFDMGLFD